jgi:hypothetical protein
LWGDPKIPGIAKKNYLKYLYEFEILVPFEVLPLLLDAAIPTPLPMLETLSKIFNGNAVKGLQLHPVTGEIFRRRLKFQTRTLNKFFLACL